METVRPLIDQRRHTLILSIAPGLTRIVADPTRIEQVLVNLLNNAVKFTEPGGEITLTARRERDLIVTVRDNGLGIPPELLPFIFDLVTRRTKRWIGRRGSWGLG